MRDVGASTRRVGGLIDGGKPRLSTRSEEFRGHWATHDVRLHNKGEKRFNHLVVGELELSYNGSSLPPTPA